MRFLLLLKSVSSPSLFIFCFFSIATTSTSSRHWLPDQGTDPHEQCHGNEVLLTGRRGLDEIVEEGADGADKLELDTDINQDKKTL